MIVDKQPQRAVPPLQGAQFDAVRCAHDQVEAVRFANEGTRAVLERILDDLLQRIDDRRIAAEDAAAIVRRLRAFCAEPAAVAGLRSRQALCDALDPERFVARARALAASYARLASPRTPPAKPS